jgi:iron(III) transport system permease protein
MRVAILALVAFLVLAIALPLATLLSKSFQDSTGRFIGLANYARYFSTPSLVASLWNSFWVAMVATIIVVPLAFFYAYGLTRTRMRAKGFFLAVALLPLFAPSLLSAISLIYIFGNQGFLKTWLFGASVYGPIGIILAQVFYCLPHAMMILITALALADGRLYEAAEAMGTPRWRVFLTVTLPGVRYGLISAMFVVFTLVVTDFGIAKVIGGQFNVLATDAYKQVIGQQNFEMGAVVGFVLLVPAVVAFALDRHIQRRQVALLSARAVPLEPRVNRLKDTAFSVLLPGDRRPRCSRAHGVAVWERSSPIGLQSHASLKNYNFAEFEPTALGPRRFLTYGCPRRGSRGTIIFSECLPSPEKGQGFASGGAFTQLLAAA